MTLVHTDFFVNNRCNLNCKHCYVNPKFDNNALVSIEQIIKYLDEAIDSGVRTIGCTGKEPLLTFERTQKIFEHLYKRKKEGANILYGIVTNGTLLNEDKAKILNNLELDYLDVSIDGTEEIHDSIRGKGNFKRTTKNLANLLTLDLNHLNKNNIFIDFTLSQTNKNDLTNLMAELFEMGLQNIYISPYEATKKEDKFVLTPEQYANSVHTILDDSKEYVNMKLFFKNSYDTKENIKELTKKGIVDLYNLYQDEIGTIYFIIKKNQNIYYFNLLKGNSNFLLRLNSNGDVTTCHHMFKNQEYSSFGNIKYKSIKKILKP